MYCDLMEEYRKGIFTNHKELYNFVNNNFTEFECNMLERYLSKPLYARDAFSRLKYRSVKYFETTLTDKSNIRSVEECDRLRESDSLFEVELLKIKYTKNRVLSNEEVSQVVYDSYMPNGTPDILLYNISKDYGVYGKKLGKVLGCIFDEIFKYIFKDICLCCKYMPFVKSYEEDKGRTASLDMLININSVERAIILEDEEGLENAIKNPENREYLKRFVDSCFGGEGKRERNKCILYKYLNLDGDITLSDKGKYVGFGDFNVIANQFFMPESTIRNLCRQLYSKLLRNLKQGVSNLPTY